MEIAELDIAIKQEQAVAATRDVQQALERTADAGERAQQRLDSAFERLKRKTMDLQRGFVELQRTDFSGSVSQGMNTIDRDLKRAGTSFDELTKKVKNLEKELKDVERARPDLSALADGSRELNNFGNQAERQSGRAITAFGS